MSQLSPFCHTECLAGPSAMSELERVASALQLMVVLSLQA